MISATKSSVRRINGSPQIHKAYDFLIKKENEKATFTLGDLVAASGWKFTTARGMLSKKLHGITKKIDDTQYRVNGATCIAKHGFCQLCSQSRSVTLEILKPNFPEKAEEFIDKAKDAALAAVQSYNNPNAGFKSGNYIILMVIAYTALLHAVWERDAVDYRSTSSDGSLKMSSANEPYLWDLRGSVRNFVNAPEYQYHKGFKAGLEKNVQIITELRDKIEHRQMPLLDPTISAHCQTLLFNFETILIQEFTDYHALNASLSIALQFSTQRSAEVRDAMRRVSRQDYESIKEYIHNFERGLADELLENPNYAFRVHMIPMPAKDARRSDFSAQYIDISTLSLEQKSEIQEKIFAIKSKNVFVDYGQHCALFEKNIVALFNNEYPSANINGALCATLA